MISLSHVVFLIISLSGLVMAKSASPQAATTLTILVDGIMAPSSRMPKYGRALGLQPSEFVVFPYDNSGRVPFDQLGLEFSRFVKRQHRPVNVVAFSMGGVVVRSALLLEPKLPLKRVAFINTPHHGTWLASSLPDSQPYPGIRDLSPGSDLMHRLSKQAWTIPTFAIWCPGDLMILPGCSAKWSQATRQECCWVPAHIWPLHSKHWISRVGAFLRPAG